MRKQLGLATTETESKGPYVARIEDHEGNTIAWRDFTATAMSGDIIEFSWTINIL